jgi:hypothetical protein
VMPDTFDENDMFVVVVEIRVRWGSYPAKSRLFRNLSFGFQRSHSYTLLDGDYGIILNNPPPKRIIGQSHFQKVLAGSPIRSLGNTRLAALHTHLVPLAYPNSPPSQPQSFIIFLPIFSTPTIVIWLNSYCYANSHHAEVSTSHLSSFGGRAKRPTVTTNGHRERGQQPDIKTKAPGRDAEWHTE